MKKIAVYGITFVVAMVCMGVLIQGRLLWSQETTSAQQEQREDTDAKGSLLELKLKEKLQSYMEGLGEELKKNKSPAGRNLQVLTHLQNKVELQTSMQMIQNSLGVTCKYCHNLTGFEIDEEGLHKDVAREMMKLQISINQQIEFINEKLSRDSENKLLAKVTCNTCHQGQTSPPDPDEKWDAMLSAGGLKK